MKRTLLQKLEDWAEYTGSPCAREALEEIKRLQPDAERYRFLRQPMNAIVYAKDHHAWGQNASGHVRYDTPEQLDAAVDAAKLTPNQEAKP